MRCECQWRLSDWCIEPFYTPVKGIAPPIFFWRRLGIQGLMGVVETIGEVGTMD